MVAPADIAAASHKILCEDNLIPRGLSEPHDFLGHINTSGIYALAVNGAELPVTGEEVANAILITSEWDGDKPETWRHPSPDVVVEYLNHSGVV